MKALSVEQMKTAEQLAVSAGSSYLQLMEQAGDACTGYLLQQHAILNQNIVVLVGNGNNGGDGFVIARLLFRRGANVTVLLCQGEPKTPESIENQSRLPSEVPVITLENWNRVLQVLNKAFLFVDAVFGTGFHGTMSAALMRLFDAVNHCGAPVYAVDVPSGLSGDTGDHCGCFLRAHTTMALGAYKIVHSLPQTADICGKLVLLDIGIPAEAFDGITREVLTLDKEVAGKLLPKRLQDTNKGDYGKLLLIAGSIGMSGAAMMATKAALRSGAGVTILACPDQVATMVAPLMMEAMTIPLPQNVSGGIAYSALPHLTQLCQSSSAVVLGCGLGQSEDTKKTVRALLQQCHVPIVLDADGINAIASDINMIKQLNSPVIMTPHPGELARMLGITIDEVESNRVKLALSVSRNLGIILVLKGHETLVAMPNGTIYQNTTGNAGMAKGGSGDVLAGIIGGLMAQHHFTPEAAALLGVYLHGLAGDYCAVRYSQYSMLASDLIDALPLIFKQTETMAADPQEILSQFQ